jgi:Tfp pilus assembly protein PilN
VISNLNLSSRPFRNRVLPWSITGVVTTISLVLLVLIIRAGGQVSAQAGSVQQDIRDLNKQLSDVQSRAKAVKESLPAEQQQALEAAHALYSRKHFSWTRLFADLEAVLPSNVRVTHIKVRDVLGTRGQTVADLELTIVGKNPSDVTEMITEMDRGGVLQAELLAENLQKGKGESGTESTLSVRYSPPARASAESGEHRDNIAAATGSAAKPPKPEGGR